MKVIGIVGEKASGKETWGNLLFEFLDAEGSTYTRIRSSDILNETLNLWHIPSTRENLQKLPVGMESMFGEGSLTRAVEARIRSLASDIVIFDGVRWYSDVAMIRSFPDNLLIYVTACVDTRFMRIRNRKEKVGEFGLSYEQFLKEEHATTEIHIPKIGKGADYTFENNGDVLELSGSVGDFYQSAIR